MAHRVLIAFVVAFAAALPSAACETVCTLDLLVVIAPSDTTLIVGESFQPEISLAGCGGREQVKDTFTLESLDTNVVVVGTSGRITAVGVGEADVDVSGATYRELGRIRVVVEASSR